MVIGLVGALPHVPQLSRLWRTYEHHLERHPILTQSCTSAVLWGVGDLLAQKIANTTSPSAGQDRRAAVCAWDPRRTALTGAFGAAFIGPAGHCWYSWLDKLALLFGPEGTKRFLFAKVAADSTIWSAAYLAAYFCWGALVIDGGSVVGLKQQLAKEFVPTYVAEVAAWPPIMFGIFSRLPSKFHLLAVNLFTICDVVALAMIQSGALSFTLPGAQPSNGEALSEEPGSVQYTAHAHSQSMVPALASMHSSSGGSSTSRKPSKGTAAASAVTQEVADAPAVMGSPFSQLFEAWVPKEHRPPC